MRLTLFRLNRIAALARAKKFTNCKTTGQLLLLVAICASLSSSAFAGIYAVGTCTTHAHYASIQEAINSVPSGSTIEICPNTYYEQLVINQSLTLKGISADSQNNVVIAVPNGGAVINASDLFNSEATAAQILVQTPSSQLSNPITVNISNIAVDGTNNNIQTCATDLVGIYYQNANGTVDQVVARFQELPPGYFGCQDGLAIYAQSGYSSGGTSKVTIENSSVHDYDKNGITADGSGTVATISGNYVVGIGTTTLTAQNGIQLSDGASGKVSNNTVTDDVYVNPSNCYDASEPQDSSCYSASGILLYDSGGTSGSHVTVSGNTLSNTQGAIVALTDGAETADYNDVSLNKITTTPAIAVTGFTYLLDGIDLCSNNNTATSNTVFNSAGAGVHLDSSCTEPGGGSSGSGTATHNTVNEACAGVLTGNNGGAATGTLTYNVVATTQSGDTCPSGSATAAAVASKTARLKTRPFKH
jgi:hypothetical protein